MSGLRKVRIQDASSCKKLFDVTTVQKAEDYIRDNLIYADSEFTCGVRCSFPGSYSVVMSLIKTPTGSFINDVLNHFFFKKKIYKVSVIISSDDEIAEEVLVNEGFEQEAILHDEIYSDGFFKDAGLFYITLPCYKRYNVAFIPFQRGVIAVSGGMDYVDSVSFLNYGVTPSDDYLRLCADYNGLIKDGKLCPRGGTCYEDYSTDGLPAEVIRAVNEIKEYLRKDRTSFDIVVKIPESSDFRLAVWEQIKKIPYGYTRSYEDIALELTEGDKKKASKLTRAVGHACAENPVPIIVPCHRVIGKDGKLVGFAGGVEFKDFLLTHELFAGLLLN